MSDSIHAAGNARSTSSHPADTAPRATTTAGDVLARTFIAMLFKEAGVTPPNDAPMRSSGAGNASADADRTGQEADDALLREVLSAIADDNSVSVGHSLRPDLVAVTILLARAVATDLNYLKELRAGAPIATISTGDAELNTIMHRAVTICLGANRRVFSEAERIFDVSVNSATLAPLMIVCRDEGEQRRAREDEAVTTCISKRYALIGLAADTARDLSRNFARVASYTFKLGALDAPLVAMVIETITGTTPSRALRADLERLLDINDLSLAFRPGFDADTTLARLEELLIKKTAFDAPGPVLEDLNGYGAAKEWGLALVADLGAYRADRIKWADIDGRGLLLSGPPGTGKTSFARALAKSARVPFVASSVAQWNAANYLSGTLQLIRKTFADAKKMAPCVLLIDELDGISDRARLTGDYVEYWSQIVNCLLEELAGAESRDGVVVIGCSNHPDRIDPAVRRAGRLDREIRVDLPGTADLALIFRHHLGADALAGVDLTPVAIRAAGKTGADVEAYCRRAKAAARRAGRDLTINDLMAEVAGQGPKPMGRRLRHTIAIHEAGHAVALIAAGRPLLWMAINDQGGVTQSTASPLASPVSGEELGAKPGQTAEGEQLTESPSDHGLPDHGLPEDGKRHAGGPSAPTSWADGMNWEPDVDRAIQIALAGFAAEKAVFGQFMIANVHAEGDLAIANRIALQFETASGLGRSGLVQLDRVPVDHLSPGTALHEAMRARLDAAMAGAVALVERHRPVLDALADALARTGFVSGPDAIAMAAERGLTIGSGRRAADPVAVTGDRGSDTGRIHEPAQEPTRDPVLEGALQ
jgi:hypothetical protein